MQSKAANHLICAFLRRCLRQMKRLGMNQTDLAKRMQVSRPYITKLMSGDVNITFETALRLAKAVGMDFFPELRSKGSKNTVLKVDTVSLEIQPEYNTQPEA